MPYPTEGEETGHYVSRFMGSPEAQSSFPDQKQRAAVAYSIARQRHLAKHLRGHRHSPGNHNPQLMTGERAMGHFHGTMTHEGASHPPRVSANSTATAG